MNISIPNFSLAKILVIGDIMLDQYYYGVSNRLSPESSVPVINIKKVKNKPGGAANVAINVATLGCNSHLIGVVGVDNSAKILRRYLKKDNVSYNLISLKTHPTITKLRIFSNNKNLIRMDFEKYLDVFDSNRITHFIQLILPNINAVILSDYAKGTLKNIVDIINLVRSYKIPVFVDPKGLDFNKYKGATIITPNLNEFEAVVGSCKDEETLVKKGMKMIYDYKLTALLITRSEKGMTLLQQNKNPLNLPSLAQNICDVTGAGDTVIGVLAAGVASGNSLEESCFLANAAAGIIVEKKETSSIKSIDLKNFAIKYVKTCFGIMNKYELKKAIQFARKRGEKIVMTNGIFDILHIGHVNYLKRAKKLGDRLIVAVNDDNSVKSLKGENRPINSLLDRMMILSELKVVDWVIPFEEITPEKLISEFLPDILVKGGDYEIHQIAGSKEVLQNGGNVIILNSEYDRSTTTIINSIKFNKIK